MMGHYYIVEPPGDPQLPLALMMAVDDKAPHHASLFVPSPNDDGYSIATSKCRCPPAAVHQ